MSERPHQMTRRKFLLQLSALSPLVVLALKGQMFKSVALAQTGTLAPTMEPTALDCVASPAMTEGPYFVDELLNRVDIRTDPTDGSVKPGVPLQLAMTIYSVGSNSCSPLKNAFVDIWHCDASGLYSDEAANNTVGKKFLRGYQITDDSGMVNFTTIYPGWYMGRTTHIHVKVRVFSPDATPSAAAQSAATPTYEFNTQLFFDDTLTDQIYTVAPYNARGKRDTTNATDGIFNGNPGPGATPDPHDVGEVMLLKLTKNGDTYSATVNIGVDLNQPASTQGGGPGGVGGPPPGGPGGPGFGTPPAPPNG